MGNNNLVVPQSSEEDKGVTKSYVEVEGSQAQMIPGVQVRLAKRIFRPGSNKAVCLAAQTSVPINDGEIASHSDLALRLSDGTNVVMSLSFFDDDAAAAMAAGVGAGGGGAGVGCIPMNRSIINPDLYELKSGDDSRLAKVLISMALGALLGGWLVMGRPMTWSQFNDAANNSLAAVKKNMTAAAVHRQIAPRSKQIAMAPIIVPDAPVVRQSSTATVKNVVRRQSASPSHKHVASVAPAQATPSYHNAHAAGWHMENAHLQPGHASVAGSVGNHLLPAARVTNTAHTTSGGHTHSHSGRPANMFVPPPPPTAFDLGNYQWQIVGPLPGMKGPQQVMVVPNAVPDAPMPKAAAVQSAKKEAVDSKAIKANASMKPQSPAKSSPPVAKIDSLKKAPPVDTDGIQIEFKLPGVEKTVARKPVVPDAVQSRNTAKPKYESKPVPESVSEGSAPEPGSVKGADKVNLERIIIPGQ